MKYAVVLLPIVILTGCLQVVPNYPSEDGGVAVDAGSGSPDAAPADLGILDAAPVDLGILDASPADLGSPDLGAADSGLEDAGEVDAGASDAGPIDAGASDAGSALPDGGLTPAFVLVGKRQRRAISLDDGQSWTHDVNADPSFRCGDCDHDTYSPVGLAVSGTALLHATGHGAPSQIFRSTDGITWTNTATNGPDVAALMSGGGAVVTAAWRTQRSTDEGLSFSAPVMIDFRGPAGERITHARAGGFGGAGSGVFLITASDGPTRSDLQASRDLGLTWTRPTLPGGERADVCGMGAVIDAGPLVAMADVGTATICWSNDLAATLHPAIVPGARFTSGLVYTGSELLIWSRGKLHRSADGASWSTENLDVRHPDGSAAGQVSLGPVARSPSGTFVAVAGRYETQRFYRSTDGVRWDELASTAYAGGHPVTHIVWTRVVAP